MPVVSEMVEVQPASCAVLDTVAPVLSKTAECFPDPPAADASPSTPEDDTLVKTAYHLGLPNFKTFLCLRFVLAVWTIFIGAFYAEAAGWAGGALMLAVALGLTVARIVPAAWRYRVAFVAADAVVVGLGAYGFLVAQTLVRSIYLFMGLFVGAQLVIIATVYPSKRYHPFCFPTEKPGRIPAEEYRQQKARVGLAEAELPAWQLRKAPFMAAWMAAFVAFVLMVTHTGQRLMIYPGTMFKVVIPPSIPEGLELTSELVKFKTADNLTLSAYFLKPNLAAAARHASSHPDLPRLTMWIFYGNTGNMVHQMEHIVPWLQAAYPNLQFFIFSYRGYVDSDGRPHIDGLRHDIDAAVKYLRGRPDVDPDRLVAYGHSIGGALVSDILGRHPGVLKGVILSNTFLSMMKMAEVWRVAWLKPLVTERWDSEAAFRRAVANGSLPPVLFMTSRQDELIPAEHMDGLYEIARGNAKARPGDYRKVEFKDGTHNYWNNEILCREEWGAFLRRLFAREETAAKQRSRTLVHKAVVRVK